MQKKIKYGLVPAAVTLLCIAFFIHSGLYASGQARKTLAPAKAVSVTVSNAAYEKKTPRLLLSGSIEAETSVVISAKAAGRVERVQVDNGQKVSAGQELVRLENTELANTVRKNQQSVESMRAAYDNAESDYNRTAQLFSQGAVAKQTLDTSQKNLRQAQSDLLGAYANLNTAEQQYNDAVITASVSGQVANKTVTVGQVVSSGAQLMTVEDIDHVYAVVNIEQKDMGKIQPGMKADVTVDAYPGEVFTGTVEVINPTAETSNRMFQTKIKIDNLAGKLKPGMFVQVNLTVGSEVTVLAVPQSAVYQKQGLYYVFVVEEEKAVRKLVDIGELLGDKIEIKSGISENTAVATSNINNLKDGDSLLINR